MSQNLQRLGLSNYLVAVCFVCFLALTSCEVGVGAQGWITAGELRLAATSSVAPCPEAAVG